MRSRASIAALNFAHLERSLRFKHIRMTDTAKQAAYLHIDR